MPLSRGKKAFVAVCLTAAVGVLAAFVHARWFDWFVRPGLWREVMAVVADDTSPFDTIREPVRELLERQVPGLRLPETFFLGAKKVPDLDGETAWVLGFAPPEAEEIYRTWLVLLDDHGRPLGRREAVPFPGFVMQVIDVGNPDKGDLDWNSSEDGTVHGDDYQIRTEKAGLIPRGCLQALHGTSIAAPVSWRVYSRARRWLPLDPRPLPSPGAVAGRLKTRFVPDLYRALAEVERLGPEWAHLAVPLLGHDDDDLRARAAAVAANDPEQGPALAPLLADPAPQVRLAAALGLLNASDAALAQQGFVELLKTRDEGIFDGELDYELARLASPATAAEAMAWALTQDSYGLHPFLDVLESLDLDDPRPIASEIRTYWRMILDQIGRRESVTGDYPVLRRLARWLARVDDPDTDAVLLYVLKKAAAGEIYSTLYELLLTALLDRGTPLRVPGAVEALREIELPELDRLLLLVHLGVPGALDDLARIGQDFSQWTYWAVRARIPRQALDRLADLALAAPHPEGDWPTWMLLANQERDVLRELEPKLRRMWEQAVAAEIVPWNLAMALVKVDLPETDRLIAGAMAAEGVDVAFLQEVFGALLARESPLRGDEGRAALEQVAQDAETYWDDSIPLTASLLLVRAGVPGAVERLLSRLREPENEWLDSPLWEKCLPGALVPGLEAMRRDGFGARVERVLAQRRRK